jgi:hypothetical protein
MRLVHSPLTVTVRPYPGRSDEPVVTLLVQQAFAGGTMLGPGLTEAELDKLYADAKAELSRQAQQRVAAKEPS